MRQRCVPAALVSCGGALILGASAPAQPIGGSDESVFNSGVLSYTLEYKGPEGRSLTSFELAYSTDLCLLSRTEGVGAKRQSTFFARGPDYAYRIVPRSPDSADVTFASSAQDVPFETDGRFYVAAGPSFPLGTGFNTFAKEGEHWRPGDPTLTLGDKSRLEFGYGSEGLDRVTRFIGPRKVNEYSFSGRLSAKGAIIPRETRRLDYVAEPPVEAIFRFSAAAFGDVSLPKDPEFEWYRPGAQINDARADPPVLWSYEQLVRATGKKKGLTPGELLVLSRERAAKFRPEMDRKRRASSTSGNSPSILPGFITIFAAVFVGMMAIMKWRDRHKNLK